MPRSRSRSFESIAQSAMTSPVRNCPAWRRKPSTSVVLPWSTCAMMAMLRTSRRTAFSVERGGAVGRRDGWCRSSHLGRRCTRPGPRAQVGGPGGGCNPAAGPTDDAAVHPAVAALPFDEKGLVLGALAGPDAARDLRGALSGRGRAGAAGPRSRRWAPSPAAGARPTLAALIALVRAPVPAGLERVHPGWLRERLEPESSAVIRAVHATATAGRGPPRRRRAPARARRRRPSRPCADPDGRRGSPSCAGASSPAWSRWPGPARPAGPEARAADDAVVRGARGGDRGARCRDARHLAARAPPTPSSRAPPRAWAAGSRAPCSTPPRARDRPRRGKRRARWSADVADGEAASIWPAHLGARALAASSRAEGTAALAAVAQRLPPARRATRCSPARRRPDGGARLEQHGPRRQELRSRRPQGRRSTRARRPPRCWRARAPRPTRSRAEAAAVREAARREGLEAGRADGAGRGRAWRWPRRAREAARLLDARRAGGDRARGEDGREDRRARGRARTRDHGRDRRRGARRLPPGRRRRSRSGFTPTISPAVEARRAALAARAPAAAALELVADETRRAPRLRDRDAAGPRRRAPRDAARGARARAHRRRGARG